MSLCSNVFSKTMTRLTIGIAMSSALLLTACDDHNMQTSTTMKATADLSVFEGCYTVSSDEPAQIKVSQQGDAWIMQMKEAASAKRVWDDPEALEVIENSEIPKFFSIDPDNVDAVLGRPDRVLVLAHVKPAYANIDPLLDSEYLSYIYRGANTIYRVECDDVNTDILANPHANIIIDNVNVDAHASS
ncbi:hypothetical protein AAJP47_00320 [Psychrobacter sp. B38]|uniref:hypothetical protein n=1 Tax=Psychrobacter sp. B38 TaxID=3143538 RepID=UPI00320FE59B